MGTRATIKFTDDYGTSYFVYRGHDGFPDVIRPDIEKAIEITTRRFKGSSEIGQLLSIFFGETYSQTRRVQEYELTEDFHGDESYKYYVEFIDSKWVVK